MAPKAWEQYEQVAVYLLNQFAHEFDLDHVEGRQTVPGHSGATWEIDGKGVRVGSEEAIVVIECRRYLNSRQTQEKVAGLAFRLIDTGAAGGILVSPLGLQEGAKKVAAHSDIVDVRMEPSSTNTEYLMRFLNKVFVGLTDHATVTETATVVVISGDDTEN